MTSRLLKLLHGREISLYTCSMPQGNAVVSFSPSAVLPKLPFPFPQVLSLTPVQTTKQPLPITLHAPSHHFRSQSFAHCLWICQDSLHQTITDTHPFLVTSSTLSCGQGYSAVAQVQRSGLWPMWKIQWKRGKNQVIWALGGKFLCQKFKQVWVSRESWGVQETHLLDALL